MESAVPHRRFPSTIYCFTRSAFPGLVVAALLLACFVPVSRGGTRKNVLMVSELGHSHPGPQIVTNAIVLAMQSDPQFEEEFYWENLDATDLSDDARNRLSDVIVQKYRDHEFDVIVLLGPDPLRLIADPSRPFYPDVPVVFCCTVPGQVDLGSTNSRSTGSYFRLDPAKTLDTALRLLPDTSQVFVIGGQSKLDRSLTTLVKAGLKTYETQLDLTYLTDLPMNELQERLKHLPSRSIVFYVSFFKDAHGREFLNTAEALPMVVTASNAPVFGVSDTYLGHGIVGGFVVSFEEQGKIAARDVLEILGGKTPQEIPVVYGPGLYEFDWRELRRWQLDEHRLPAGSSILFREPTLWERHKQSIVAGLLIFVSLSLMAIYLLLERKVLRSARKSQQQLSGMLINAQEAERSRLAAEIHDDFSQRLALLSLSLGTTAEIIPASPQEANRRLHDLSDEVSAIGSDLHTLSHRLHSASLESLGLAPTVSALCKEFSEQQGVKIDFTCDQIPRQINPEVALCVFRIVQESLRNMKKHSNAASAKVCLQLTGSTIHVLISDQGVGFDLKELKVKEGLGVRSMGERVRLLDGHFEIRSKLGEGTIIDVRLPLPKESADRIA